MPRLVDNHVGSVREGEDAVVTHARERLLQQRDAGLTGRSAVAAHVVSRHPLHLHQDGLGELLNDVVLADMLVSFEGLVQSLLLTVLKHRDPA